MIKMEKTGKYTKALRENLLKVIEDPKYKDNAKEIPTESVKEEEKGKQVILKVFLTLSIIIYAIIFFSSVITKNYLGVMVSICLIILNSPIFRKKLHKGMNQENIDLRITIPLSLFILCIYLGSFIPD